MKLKLAVLPLSLLLLVGAAIEVLVLLGFIPQFLFPAPSSVVLEVLTHFREFGLATAQTLFCSFTGLLISFSLGIGLSLLFTLSPLLRKAVFPYAILFQTVPIIAIAPLLVIWFGFGIPTVIASAAVVSIFPILAGTMSGLEKADSTLCNLFELYGAKRIKILVSLRLPTAVPNVLEGLRVAAGLALIGAIVGEFIAGGGLGGLIDVAKQQQRLDRVFGCVLLASFAGFLKVEILTRTYKFFLKKWI